jgi:hypothetical protein
VTPLANTENNISANAITDFGSQLEKLTFGSNINIVIISIVI